MCVNRIVNKHNKRSSNLQDYNTPYYQENQDFFDDISHFFMLAV